MGQQALMLCDWVCECVQGEKEREARKDKCLDAERENKERDRSYYKSEITGLQA